MCGVGQVTCGHGQLGPVGGTTVVLVASVALCKDVEMCHRAWGEGCVCAGGGGGGGGGVGGAGERGIVQEGVGGLFWAGSLL